MALDIKKFIHRFIDEAREQLRLLETGLEQLRHGEANAELVNSLFRAAHTLKGSSRMLKLLPISDTAHSLEDVLSALREQKISLNDATLDLMLEAVDALSNLTAHLTSNPDPAALPEKSAALCQRLAAAANANADTGVETDAELETASTDIASITEAPPPAAPATTASSTNPRASEPTLRSADSVRLKLDNLEQLIKLMSEVTISQAGLRELLQDARTLFQLWEASSLKDAQHSPLFTAYQQLYQGLRDVIGSQESLVQNLHEQSLGLRMLPLTQILEPARKLVREMGRELGKTVELHVIGEDIELDRQLIEQLVEPVQHLLRNALDHGLESNEQRQTAGKNPRGLIQISARQDGGWVSLDISDDGAGLDVEKIRNKALRQHLFSDEELARKSQAELTNLIFLPGFSTSTMITELSGRGVGLDVVKRSVEDLQGMVEVNSQPGQGTTFSLRLPLSLAMLRILIVDVDGHLLAFTARHVVEMIYIDSQSLLDIAERQVFVLRNEFVPVFEPSRLIQLPARRTGIQPDPGRQQLMLVLQVQHEKIALRIDRMVDERDLVIKPMPVHLARQPLVAGIVNHGYRQLVSLLHAPQLFELAQRSRGKTADSSPPGIRQHILVVDDSLNTREIEKDLLEAWGYQVTLAEDGQDGLIKARAGEFDAVLTDVEMPVMDGFTLTSHLRQDERYQHTPIIIITSREKDSDRRRGIEVGADAYIVKGSFDQNSLIDTLRVLLG